MTVRPGLRRPVNAEGMATVSQAVGDGMDMRGLTEFATMDANPAEDVRSSWSKAAPLELAADATVEAALAAALRNGLDHLSDNESCVLARDHEEGVHQMRVAVRRLRSRLSLYADLISPDRMAPMARDLKWLIGRLGPARDLDVFVLEVTAPAAKRFAGDPAFDALMTTAEGWRDRAYTRASEALHSDRYAGLKERLAHWTANSPLGDDGDDAASGQTQARRAEPVRRMADRVMESRHTEAEAVGRHFASLTPEARHELRIDIKKVRYAAEFFSSLYDRAATAGYLRVLKGLQDVLGAANDIVVARALMARLVHRAGKHERVRLAFASGLVIASQPQVETTEADALAAWEAFRTANAFWR